ncbi:MAG: DUF305 domain-containing protein [Chthoniobacterales bacterium]|nr:DUF305 domain-containing protein [Chthoniobacterales bacterium]
MTKNIKSLAPLMAAFVLMATPLAFAHDPNGKVDPMNASLAPLKGAEFEQSFLQQMIQHHESGIDMAKLVSDHTKRPELHAFASKMIASQQEDIRKMTAWLNDWDKAAVKPVANEAADKEMKMHMSMLNDKHDADFDKAFLQMMPQHHHMAVEMAEQVEKKGTHPELKEFAAKMAADQEKEIKQLKSWAEAWFGPA